MTLLLLGWFVPALAEDKPRVVSLAPHLTELAYTAGAGDTLVGAVAYSDWPEQAKDLPRIGDAYRFDMETVLGLEVDLALAWRGGTPEAVAGRLDELGIDVLWIETRTLEQIASALKQVGDRLGSSEAAEVAANDYLDRLRQLRTEHRREDGPAIFYQVSARPLFTLGGPHVITEVFEICGARNLFADLDIEAAAVDREAVVTRRPDLIIAGRSEADDDVLSSWRNARMVTEGSTRLVAVDAERLVRPTPRIIEGIELVCELVGNQPDAAD